MFEAWIHNSSIWSLICFFIVYISSLCLNLKIFNLIVFGSICLKPDGFIILLQFSSWTAFQFFIIIEHSSRTALQFFIIIHHSSWTAFQFFIIIRLSSRTALQFFNDISFIYSTKHFYTQSSLFFSLLFTVENNWYHWCIYSTKHFCTQSSIHVHNQVFMFTVKFCGDSGRNMYIFVD